MLVKVKFCDFVCPSATLPKLKLAGVMLNPGCAAEPVSETVSVALAALLVIVTLVLLRKRSSFMSIVRELVGPWLVLTFLFLVLPFSRMEPGAFYFGKDTIPLSAQTLLELSLGDRHISLTMATTIDHVTITPVNPTIAVGASVALTMNAFDAQGRPVVEVFGADFEPADSTIAKVTIGGNPSGIKGLSPGSTLITVTDQASGKTASTTVTVTGSTQ